MRSQQDSETLVRVGPDTAMGSLFRLFWIPFLFSRDLIADGQPKRIMLLGEDLVAFRDTQRAGSASSPMPVPIAAHR